MPTLVITEVAYLLETRLGVDPAVRFLGDLAAGNLIATLDRRRFSIAQSNIGVLNLLP